MAREVEMPRIELLDPTRNGRSADHLVGQEEAIHQIVTADWRLSVPGGSALFRLEGRVSIVREISFPETAEC